MKSQKQMFYEESRKIAERCEMFSDMVKDGMTKAELEKLIAKRPEVWGMFSSWLTVLN